MRVIERGTEEVAISEFNSSHQTLKEGIRRANELSAALTNTVVGELEGARHELLIHWPVLDGEPDLETSIREATEKLTDLLGRETFYRELTEIARIGKVLEAEHARRFGEALAEKVAVYQDAMTQLVNTPGWSGFNDEARARSPLACKRMPTMMEGTIPRLASFAPTGRPASLACDRLSKWCTSWWTVSGS